jgi:Tol biopolymer transport system component
MKINGSVIGVAMVAAICWVSLSCTAGIARAAEVAPKEFSVDNLPAIAPAFSPDGKTVIFGRSVGQSIMIFEAEKSGGSWGPAKPAAFSGTYRDLEPTFAPSGKYLIFASNRPLQPGGKLVDGNYNGKIQPAAGGHLWKVERRGASWGEPQPLPASINVGDSVFSPSITGDGSLYFMRPVNAGEKFHLFRAQMKNGSYAIPERVSFSNLQFGDYDPAVSRDDRFIIFSSGRPPAHRTDLFIVYRKNGQWSEPQDLSETLSPDVYGTEARLDPKERTLFFTNTRKLPTDHSADEKAYFIHSWEVALPARH